VRERSRFQVLSGRDEAPADLRDLRAGPLTAVLDGIDLRYVRVGDVEVVRRLFVAVRDDSWATIPPQLGEIEVEQDDDAFRVTFEAYHEAGSLRFRWRGALTGSADGSLDCRLDGVPENDFPYNRIGFCVLHPRQNAGRPYRTQTPDGSGAGRLPDEIGPQKLEDGKLWPLFPSYERLDVEVVDGLWAEFAFEGDLFEMEDQRNWTDASFKTYSTPLTLGVPHHARQGQPLVQSVRLTFSGETKRPAAGKADRVRLELGEPRRELLPPFGLGMASHGHLLAERELELVEGLRIDHVRADLDLSGPWREELGKAGDLALSLGASLELALFLGDDREGQVAALAEALPLAQAGVARFLVLEPGQAVTGSSVVALARERLASAAPGAAFACGTNQWFTELNRERPDVGAADAIVYSVCATVHAEDDISVAETPAAQGDTVRSARALFGRPVAVSPVTFRPRFWPFGELEGYRGLPFRVDPRQCSLFGAAWTVASVKHLLEAGAASLTYFETSGPGGVVEREAGAPADVFASRPGQPFPLYHVLADLGDWRQAVLLPSRSSEPLAVESLAVRTDRGTHVLAANLTAATQRCRLELPEREVSLRVLDAESADAAGEDPEAFRARREKRSVSGGVLEFELGPYAVVRVDP
jgi:hypothetical protein